jgi:hypothetical protein
MRFPLIRVLGITLLAAICSLPITAAQTSRTFYLATAARAGNTQLPRGICEVSWSVPSGSHVQLTIKAEDQKIVRVLARVVEGNQTSTGAVTSVVNGVTYLKEFHTSNARFIFQNKVEASK